MKLTGDEQERTPLGPAFRGLEAGLDPAGTGVMGIGLAAEVLEVWGVMAGLLRPRWQRGLCSSERLTLGAVALGDGALALQDRQEAADPLGKEGEDAE